MEEALKARNGDPLKAELDNALKRLGRVDHGKRVVVGSGEASWTPLPAGMTGSFPVLAPRPCPRSLGCTP